MLSPLKNQNTTKSSYYSDRISMYHLSWFAFFLFLVCFMSGLIWQSHRQAHGKSPTDQNYTIPHHINDKGIFNDLDAKVKYHLPSWLSGDDLQIAQQTIKQQQVAILYYHHYAIAYFTLSDGALKPEDQQILKKYAPHLNVQHIPSVKKLKKAKRKFMRDQDRDGIANGLDLLVGTHKVRINAAEYRQGYERMKYPNGDVKRDHGVCTDVIVRAYRNAGWDLQKILYRDMLKRPRAYGLKKGKKPNRHIEHRRVRRLIVYFKRYYKSLPIEFSHSQQGKEAWLPGDLVFMDTFGVGYPTHVGLVSDRLGKDGEPLIVNNWTDGYVTSEMSLRSVADYTHRFRITLRK